MRQLWTRRFALSWALLVILGGTASAQIAMPPSQGPGTLSGVVVDSLGRPVPEATVYIVNPRRTTLTRVNGAFRFDSVPEGTYSVGARAIGYASTLGRVPVKAAGTEVILLMSRFAVELPSMTTAASRGGLSGVIGDTSFRAMAGVTVRVLGSGAGSAKTDSLGEFYLPVKPGRYMVRLERPGYRRQLVGVTVPANEGRRIAAWLSPMSGKENPIVGKNLWDLEQRMMMRSPVWSKVYTNEDLVSLGIDDALQAAERFSARRLQNDECARINGGPSEAPLWAISTAEIEFMETTIVGGTRGSRPDMNDNTAMMRVAGGRKLCSHVVWLRK